MKMSKEITLLLLGILLGAAIVATTVGGGSGSDIALGQSDNSTNGYILQSFRMQGKGDAEGLALFDTNSRKLVIYLQDSRSLTLMSVRDLQYDLVPQEYSLKGGRQQPTVADMKKGVRKN